MLTIMSSTFMYCNNSVVDTWARRARQVQDKTPFPRLVAFGDDAETTHMENREERLGEGARPPACLNFRLQVIVDDLRVEECLSHIPRL